MVALQSLGNHEFDDGLDGLLPFLNAAKFPVLTANINSTADNPIWHTRSFKKSIVLKVKGFLVGIIGYLTPETENTTTSTGVDFSPEIESIK